MFNFRLLSVVLVLILACAGLGLLRLDIDTDIVRSLPTEERIIGDGLEIFRNHPIHDQIAIDIVINRDDPDLLVECGAFLEQQLLASGLFSVVGIKETGNLIPDLALHVVKNLPLLYSERDLEQHILPLLQGDTVYQRLGDIVDNLGSLEGIGQAQFIETDPLGLKDSVLARMAPLAPSLDSRFYKGSLISADGRHLLVTAKPISSGTNTKAAGAIAQRIAMATTELSQTYTDDELKITVTPVGAYRAALDNEHIIRHDVQQALLLATGGIALLLLFSFHRPVVGLLSLVPALAGTAAALLVYSLFHSSISIMILGFGGAIISITVDHGIAYLLFLDRSHTTSGKDAAREVRAVAIMAVLTTIGAFMVLSFSGFPIFTQLGQFTALGIFFSFCFVHSVFPRIFPVMPPATQRSLPLRKIVNMLYSTGNPGAVLAAVLALGMLFFAKPQFHVSLNSMNTVSTETMKADTLFSEVWGNIGDRVYLMTSANSAEELQRQNDHLLKTINPDIHATRIDSAFVPSMLFPGQEQADRNLVAWKKFWNQQRVEELTKQLTGAGEGFGFTKEAFSPFLSMLNPVPQVPEKIALPGRYNELMGIAKNNETGRLIQFITITPGEQYDPADFFARYSPYGKIFDADYFSIRLADILFSTFTTMLLIIAISISLFLLFFYLNLQLTLLTLLPAIFAYICTLGTLNLIGHPLDIPGLMLSIVILGMGIDYSIFTVRAHQRYLEISHPSYALVRTAVFMAGASTLIGFGVLAFAEHSLLRSIGITSFFGIAYSLLGAFLLLPPLLNRYFSQTDPGIKNGNIKQRIRKRFRLLEAYPRMFTRFKLQFDPLFDDLPRMLEVRSTDAPLIMDIGCGYGIPACWCLESLPQSRVFGIDPDPERVRVAARAIGCRGTVVQGWAPALPEVPEAADVVLLLDMLHYLDDEAVCTLLELTVGKLASAGILVTRFVVRPDGPPSWSWRLEDYRIKLSGGQAWYRSADRMTELLTKAGLCTLINEVSTTNPELVWMVGRADTNASDAK